LAFSAIRTSNLAFFRARAAQARAEAEDAVLDHVKERCQRSEAAWNALADRVQRAEQMRIADEERKSREAL